LVRGVFDKEVRRKPQAFAAVAVILMGDMDIESHLVFGCLRAAFSPLMMVGGEQMAARSVIGPFWDAVGGGDESVPHAGRTLPGRGALSKPRERVGEAHHEVSKPAK
jgi:hypothetical protein